MGILLTVVEPPLHRSLGDLYYAGKSINCGNICIGEVHG